MTSTVTIVHVGLPETQVAEVEIREPGIIRHVAIGAEQQALVGINGKQAMRERVVLFVEVDPQGTARKRKFLQLPPGVAFQPKDGSRAVWRGLGMSVNTGAIVYVYELVELVSVASLNASTTLVD